MASPLVVSGLTMGAGLEWMRPSRQPERTDDYGKLSLGGGLRLGRGLGVGVMWEHLFRLRYAGLDGLSAGLGWQPASFLAAGLAVRDMLRPRPVAGRPAAAARVGRRDRGPAHRQPPAGAGGGVRMLEGDDDTRFLPHGRLSVGVYPGVLLFADVEAPRARLRSWIPGPSPTRPRRCGAASG